MTDRKPIDIPVPPEDATLLRSCANNHEEIYYAADSCPACVLFARITELEKQMESQRKYYAGED